MDKLYIQDWSRLKNNSLFHQERLCCTSSREMDVKTFAKECYEALHLNYPKFHKMDHLCKLGILAAEVLFRNNPIKSDAALVLSNNASSLETDEKHQATIVDKENYFPSPAVFVYTLPNIVLGEISIKHDLKSEQVFFVSEEFDPLLLTDYAEILLNTQKTDQVICGWIDLHKSIYDVFLCLISNRGNMPLTKENLQNIYTQKS